MATKIVNTVKFKNVLKSDDAVHTYPSILRYNSITKVSVKDENASTWVTLEDGFASEAIAQNETHALVPYFDKETVEIPEAEKPTTE